jgi:tripartite-type tricarboxylate transporter receptor subunit TctC
MKFSGIVLGSFAMALGLGSGERAHAQQSVADFYRGRTMSMLIGYTVGGGYDTYARVLARHMGKRIPGNPSITPQNMVGAGSLKLANYLYSVAPKDGTQIGIFGRGIAMEPLIGTSGASFDGRKFTWLGSGSDQVSVCVTWHTSKVKTWNDALTTSFTVGGEGAGADPDMFTVMLKNMFGAKIRLVTGYPGGNEISIALERGEVDGRCGWSWTSVKLAKADWIANKSLNFIVQMSLAKSPELPNVPFVMDFAKTDEQRQILKLVLGRQTMGWPFAAPPGIPEDRKQALRRAFEETMADPEFLAEAKQRVLDVNPLNGAGIDRLMSELYQTPPEVIARAKAVIAAEPAK